MEKENTTGLKMPLQLTGYIPTSLKRKVNQRFTAFFPYKKDECLSFIKVGCFILKESRNPPTTFHCRASNFSRVISHFFSPRIILYYKAHTTHIYITTEAITWHTWHTCAEAALHQAAGPGTRSRFLS